MVNLELICLEQLVQFSRQVVCMSGVGERYLEILGPWMIHEAVERSKVDGFTLIEHCIDTASFQYLLALVGLGICVI